MPVLTAAKVPLVGMFTGAQGLREPFNRQVFHVRSSYFDETERIVPVSYTHLRAHET